MHQSCNWVDFRSPFVYQTENLEAGILEGPTSEVTCGEVQQAVDLLSIGQAHGPRISDLENLGGDFFNSPFFIPQGNGTICPAVHSSPRSSLPHQGIERMVSPWAQSYHASNPTSRETQIRVDQFPASSTQVRTFNNHRNTPLKGTFRYTWSKNHKDRLTLLKAYTAAVDPNIKALGM